MGLCVSKSKHHNNNNNTNTNTSPLPYKCRFDKHGNVFFPLTTINTTTLITTTNKKKKKKNHKKKKIAEEEEEAHCPNHHHHHRYFFTKALRQHLTNASSSIKAAAVCGAPLPALTAAAAAADVSTAECSNHLTRSASSKEPTTISRCSTHKEEDSPLDAPQDSSAAAAAAANEAAPPLQQQQQQQEELVSKESTENNSVAAAEDSSSKNASSASSSLNKVFDLPAYQSLIFSATSSPHKVPSTPHSSLSSDEFSANPHHHHRQQPHHHHHRRRSPSRKSSPNRRTSPSASRRSSPNKAARQKSPIKSMENIKPTVVPHLSRTLKSYMTNERSILKELPCNEIPPKAPAVKGSNALLPLKSKACQQSVPTPSTKEEILTSPSNNCSSAKSEKFSVYSDAIHLDLETTSSSSDAVTPSTSNTQVFVKDEPRTGSKRLRSPKKFISKLEKHESSREYLNFNISLPGSDSTTNESIFEVTSSRGNHAKVSYSEAPERDHAGSESEDDEKFSGRVEPHILELLERTPKKLKKMALKLALKIEMQHSQDDDDDDVKKKSGKSKKRGATDVDLELKLGMPAANEKKKEDVVRRFGLSVAMDSPIRRSSASLPVTPRHSISSTCHGLSVEARIGTSKDRSDFSFHILKNPEKLFGGIPRFPQKPTSHEGKDSEDSPVEPRRCSSFGFDTAPVVPEGCADYLYDGEGNKNVATPTPSARRRRRGRKDLDLNVEADDEIEAQSSPTFEFKVESSEIDDDINKSLPPTPSMPSSSSTASSSSSTAAPPPSTPLTIPSLPPPLSSSTAAAAAKLLRIHHRRSQENKEYDEEEDALSLSADEIAEIWGAFEASQESK